MEGSRDEMGGKPNGGRCDEGGTVVEVEDIFSLGSRRRVACLPLPEWAYDAKANGGVFSTDATPEPEGAADVEAILERSTTDCLSLRRRCKAVRDRRSMAGGRELCCARQGKKVLLYRVEYGYYMRDDGK